MQFLINTEHLMRIGCHFKQLFSELLESCYKLVATAFVLIPWQMPFFCLFVVFASILPYQTFYDSSRIWETVAF